MLGTTLMYLSSDKLRNEDWKQYNLDRLRENADNIINRVGSLCYNIIYLMVTDRKDRIYLDHLTKIINAYKQHSNCDKILTIKSILNIPNDNDNTIITKISESSIYEKNITTMMNYGHCRIRDSIKKLDSNSIKTFRNIHSIDKLNTEHEDTYKKTSNILFENLRIVLVTSYGLKQDIAGFFSNVIAYYPLQRSVKEWIKQCTKNSNGSNKITIEDINNAAIKLCLHNINIDYHLLTCTSCLDYVKEYNDINKDKDYEYDMVCSSNYNPAIHQIIK